MSAQNIEDVYPVSPVQEGMLFHSLYQVGGGVYVTQFTCLLQGLDVSLFEQSWQQAVDRHSILRTAFVWKSVEKPLQLVGRRVKISIPRSDLRGLSPDEQEGRVGSYLREDRERGFDVAKAPLMRFVLFQVGADSYRFVWSHHHLLLDGWATAVLLKEVLSFYDGQARAEPPRLPSPRPYRDYINWLQSQDMAQAEDYWRKTLSGFAAATRFNVDRSHPSSNGVGENHSRQQRLSRETTARLQALARQQQLTLNTVVQGAWALLLSRYSGESDVLFGAVVSGRPPELAGVEAMVGLFINTLPVRARVDESEEALGWLRRLQAEQARARQYEHSPLVEVQRWSEVAGGTPLFDCYIVVENYPIDEALKRRTGGLVVKKFASLERSSYPLTIAVTPGAELTIQMHFDTDRFDGPVIERMLGHLTTLLEEFADDPNRSLARVSMLTRAERRQLLVDWNAKTNEPPSTQLCVHQLVEEQASRSAHDVAVVDEDRRLTYGELNERANRLARHLRGIGVGPESRVGLCVGRSADAVVGLLGILKAGGVYVPLDPQYPRERLQFMIEDAGLAVLLTQLSLSDALPQKHQAQVVYIDAGWGAVARQSADNLPNVVSPGNLAYIIYTSGSTGKPKGIGIPHEAIVNHCLDIRKEFEIEAADRVLQFASLSFDVSLEQVLPTLLAGARLVLRGDSFWNASDFARVLEAEELSVVNFPTAYWHQLTQEWVDGGGSNVAHRLRLVIIGGDTILPEAVRLW
ncbi:MAG TPA: condensation domain-containing protein, partial [Pyrinomonadaceae bacterium]